MAAICLVGIDRPSLIKALAARGLVGVPMPGESEPSTDLADSLLAPPIILMRRAADQRGVIDRSAIAGLMALVDSGEAAIIAALDAGADDAVPDRASDGLIAARLHALVRRQTASLTLVIGELSIDRLQRRAVRAGRPLSLLPREYRLLEVLARHSGQTVSRAQLLRSVCGLSFDPGTNVLEVHVSRLRAQLDRGFARPMLMTDKGRGYRLVDPGDACDLRVAASAADH